MLGVINLDKPVGPTSHDMVGLLRRLTGTRRIGHAGTLDPLASGVLPILVGPVTRFSEELTGGAKRYDAVVRLGVRSATDDGEGPLTPVEGPLPDPGRVADELRTFVGSHDQRPPDFSARKQHGRTAYRSARAGEPLDLPPRRVTIERIDLVDVQTGPGWLDVRFDLRCGPGTYVRSIARDLGERLGCGGYLHALRRTAAAGLTIESARTPETLAELAAADRLDEALLPVTDLLPLPRLMLAADDGKRFGNGSSIEVPGQADGRCAVLVGEALLGIGQVADGRLQPVKVLAGGGAS